MQEERTREQSRKRKSKRLKLRKRPSDSFDKVDLKKRHIKKRRDIIEDVELHEYQELEEELA